MVNLYQRPRHAGMTMLIVRSISCRWYGIIEFNVPLDTLWVILETILWVTWPNQQRHSTEERWLVNQVKGQCHHGLSSLKGKEKDVSKKISIYIAPLRPKTQRRLEDRELNQARSKRDTVNRPVRTAQLLQQAAIVKWVLMAGISYHKLIKSCDFYVLCIGLRVGSGRKILTRVQLWATVGVARERDAVACSRRPAVTADAASMSPPSPSPSTSTSFGRSPWLNVMTAF